jgi:hypothetical protein
MGLALPVPVTTLPLVGVQVTLKLVAAEPVLAAVKLMLAVVLPSVAAPMVGAEGTAITGKTDTALEAVPVPTEFEGVIVQL